MLQQVVGGSCADLSSREARGIAVAMVTDSLSQIMQVAIEQCKFTDKYLNTDGNTRDSVMTGREFIF